ncbi:hypothetical protein MNBD_GAMMA22-2325 [hydrothermal vent metagenome]|uniref:Outer membrane protein beta-barrel domain-containing protein n=1 Tax=hydrothermal vent metagenome TaxID=652676 RepID=A0A3B0ZXF3_9ZZZZ
MKKFKMKSNLSLFLLLLLSSMTVDAQEDINISLGVKLLSANWTGSNNDSGTDFERTGGGQFAWNIAIQKQRYYAGLNLQGGGYTFDNNAPDQVTNNTTTVNSNVIIQRSEIDLIAGYYFWENISLFIDFKSTQNKYDNNDFKQKFSGLGIGASGSWFLNDNWSLYGTFGFVARGDLKSSDEVVGYANSTALEFGGIYRYSDTHRFNIGIKSQGQKYTYNNGTSQTHNFGGFFIGYNYLFSL